MNWGINWELIFAWATFIGLEACLIIWGICAVALLFIKAKKPEAESGPQPSQPAPEQPSP